VFFSPTGNSAVQDRSHLVDDEGGAEDDKYLGHQHSSRGVNRPQKRK
jgi:hypothetical protein